VTELLHGRAACRSGNTLAQTLRIPEEKKNEKIRDRRGL
jgi:hypothetical protein